MWPSVVPLDVEVVLRLSQVYAMSRHGFKHGQEHVRLGTWIDGNKKKGWLVDYQRFSIDLGLLDAHCPGAPAAVVGSSSVVDKMENVSERRTVLASRFGRSGGSSVQASWDENPAVILQARTAICMAARPIAIRWSLFHKGVHSTFASANVNKAAVVSKETI